MVVGEVSHSIYGNSSTTICLPPLVVLLRTIVRHTTYPLGIVIFGPGNFWWEPVYPALYDSFLRKIAPDEG